MYYTEEEEIYHEKYRGHFSKRLAEWAISRMGKLNPTTKGMESIKRRTIEEYEDFISANKINIPEESFYDGYYLWHMALADYPKALEDAKHIAAFIEETICDPDGEPTNVLATFVAKMCESGVPIFWEKFI